MYPYHTGRQNEQLGNLLPTGLTLKRRLLSEELKSLGYSTHMIGKWHLGFCSLKYTPTKRGFDSFVGTYGGIDSYYTFRRRPEGERSTAFYDFR